MSYKSTVLVTGANKGIGFETARQLGNQGLHVFLGTRDEGRGKHAEQRLQAEGISCEWISMDMEQESSIQAAFEQVKTKVDHLDVLINNAAVLLDHGQSLLNMPLPRIESTFQINIIGPILATRIFLPC